MTGYERSGWRDEELSKRRRLWGPDGPGCDTNVADESGGIRPKAQQLAERRFMDVGIVSAVAL